MKEIKTKYVLMFVALVFMYISFQVGRGVGLNKAVEMVYTICKHAREL